MTIVIPRNVTVYRCCSNGCDSTFTHQDTEGEDCIGPNGCIHICEALEQGWSRVWIRIYSNPFIGQRQENMIQSQPGFICPKCYPRKKRV